MNARSRSLITFLAATLLLALGSTGCLKSKKKPEIRLARSGDSAFTMSAADQQAFGTHGWAPGSAPDGAGFGSTGSMEMGGATGFEYDPNAVAFDASGTLPNSASLAGVEQGTFVADLEMVHFPYDSSDITEDWKAVLDSHADWLKGNTAVMVQIEGHCDDRGTEEYNTSLGQRRADTVREYLASRGVDPNRMSTISYGEMRPLSFDQSEEAHMLNRRAMFLVYEAGAGQAVASAF